MSTYDGRRPEPPYATQDDERLQECVEMLRAIATEYRAMRLAFDPGDSRRIRCEELSDDVIDLLERVTA